MRQSRQPRQQLRKRCGIAGREMVAIDAVAHPLGEFAGARTNHWPPIAQRCVDRVRSAGKPDRRHNHRVDVSHASADPVPLGWTDEPQHGAGTFPEIDNTTANVRACVTQISLDLDGNVTISGQQPGGIHQQQQAADADTVSQ
jgi:hypothetical protein